MKRLLLFLFGFSFFLTFANKVSADGPFNFVNGNSHKCMGVQGASTIPGAPLVQWHCDGTLNQMYEFQAAPGGDLFIKPLHSHQCVTVAGPNGSSAPNAPIVQWPCSTQMLLNQRWFPSSGFQDGRRYYRFISDANYDFIHSTGFCIGVAGATQNEGEHLVQWPCSTADTILDHRWLVYP